MDNLDEIKRDEVLRGLLEAKAAWLDEFYERAKDLPAYRWTKLEGFPHRCGGTVWVMVEATGIACVCQRCEDAEFV